MIKQLNTLFLIFLSFNLFSQIEKIEFEDDIDQVYTRMELQGVKTDSALLYGFFFYGNDPDSLKTLSDKLKKEDFKFVRAETVDNNGTIILHMEKIEILSREGLRQREKYLRKLAPKSKVEYDGWDVGNVNPELPLTTTEGFVEYFNDLPERKLFLDSEKLYKIEDYQSALIGFDICIQREINMDTSKFYLGCCLGKLGDNENALNILKEVFEEKPKYEKAAFVIGALSYDIRNFDDAILYYQKVVELNPQNDNAFYGLAAAEYGKRNYDLTKKYCDKALEINPDNKLAKDLLEWLK